MRVLSHHNIRYNPYMQTTNIFKNIPNNLKEELFEDIISTDKLKIERIVSQGGATISFEDEEDVNLTAGDYINIPAHKKHRVT